MYGAGARPVIAQSSKMHAAFEVVGASNSAKSDQPPSAVRLVIAQQQPATKPTNPATPPPAQKPAAKKPSPAITAKTPPPAILEELPPGPMKAVLPLAGA